jgi:hypothetical protein
VDCPEGRAKRVLVAGESPRNWSGQRESNPHVQLGKLTGYHYIMAALRSNTYPDASHMQRKNHSPHLMRNLFSRFLNAVNLF